MSLKILVGQSQFDAVNYCRALTEDLVAPFVIPDTAYQTYAEDVVEDFSRHVPLNYVVGTPYTLSSPLVTVNGQQRYVCSTANGFSAAPMIITDVLSSAGTGYSAASEVAYLALLPFSPINKFLIGSNMLDSPTERILRDSYLEELSHYGHGYFKIVTDPATGLLAIDLYPIPAIANTPIYVRYLGIHGMTTNVNGDLVIPTIPAVNKRDFAKLLYALILEEEGDRLIKSKMAKTGMVEIQADTRMMEMRIVRIKDEVYGSLGSFTGVIMASGS